jgi:hypothetical protein
MRRLRTELLAKRGSVAAPAAAASQGVALSRPIVKGEKCPDAPMIPGRKKITV